jgi:uncharacterized phage protein (TIGR01671 family)
MNNREFKFRIWNVSDKTWMDEDFWIGINNFGLVVNDRNDAEDLSLCDNCIIQQFTGLKDKNEKEIYEGDIVETIYADELHIGEIIFDNNTCAYRIKTKQNLLPIITYRFDENYNPKGLLQVATLIIGNIFENSDLII